MPVFSVHVFNVKSILCIVNYMIIRRSTMLTSNIHNRTPKSGILFTNIYIIHRRFLQHTRFYKDLS